MKTLYKKPDPNENPEPIDKDQKTIRDSVESGHNE